MAATLAFIFVACNTALKTNGVVVTTVDGSMKGWAIWTQTHSVPDAQIIAVSNAYNAYYQSELVLSNSFVVAVTQTNNSLLQTVTASARASEQNLINLIQQFSK
jgi:hypothetical protein